MFFQIAVNLETLGNLMYVFICIFAVDHLHAFVFAYGFYFRLWPYLSATYRHCFWAGGADGGFELREGPGD